MLPLIDTCQRFNMPKEGDYSQKSVTILELQSEGERVKVGSVMDEVLNVIEISADKGNLSIPAETEYRPEFILGAFEHKGQLYRMIDIDEVFSIERIILSRKTIIN